MRHARMSLWAFAMLAIVTGAQAQNAGIANGGQIERGVSLSVPSPQPAPEVPDLTRTLQQELKRVGCFDGVADGRWGEKTKAALMDFARRSKLDIATDAATESNVQMVQTYRERVCPLDCGSGRIERNGVCVAKAAPPPPAAAPRAAPQVKRAPQEKSPGESSGSGMCWTQTGRGTALVPCSEAPTGRRAY